MMEEHRKHVRSVVSAKASLKNSSVSANVFDVSDHGLGVQIPRRLEQKLSDLEVIQITTPDRKMAPCNIEAQLRWDNHGIKSTLAGFEIRSLQSPSCKDMLDSLVATYQKQSKSRKV